MRIGLGSLRRASEAWWQSRSRRERALVAAMAALAALAALQSGLVRPLLDARAEASARIEEHERSLALLAAAPAIARPARLPEGSAPALLTESAAASGLTILRIAPEGTGASLVLADADFARLVAWIEAVERETGLRLTRARMERRPAPGTVGAELVFGAR